MLGIKEMISAVILTKNEEDNIKDCLEGLKWCDEIIVIDDNSTDKTKELAQKAGAKIIIHSLDNNFGEQRNFSLEQTSHDWIFFIDADERVTPELAEEIQRKIKKTTVIGFYCKRIDNFLGRWLKHGEISATRIIRLARRGSGKWTRIVDELWEVSGKTETFNNPLLHYSHQTLTEFLTSINERSTLNSECFYQEGKRVTFFEWMKPKGKFFLNYFIRLGFLDGTTGFVFAVLMCLHSFLVRAKLYLIWRRRGGWK